MNLTGKLSAQQGLAGKLSAEQGLAGMLSTDIFIKTQTKVATPTNEVQTITADAGYAGLSAVTINPIPQNYGLITYDGVSITVS